MSSKPALKGRPKSARAGESSRTKQTVWERRRWVSWRVLRSPAHNRTDASMVVELLGLSIGPRLTKDGPSVVCWPEGAERAVLAGSAGEVTVRRGRPGSSTSPLEKITDRVDYSRSGFASGLWVVAAVRREQLVGLLHPGVAREGSRADVMVGR